MLIRAKKLAGFTLVEVMITVLILAIVTTIAFPQYMIWMQNQRMRNGAESILNGLQKARAEAVKRNLPVSFVLGANTAWSVGCVTVTANCPAIIEQRLTSEGSSAQISATSTPAGATTMIYTNFGLLQPKPPSPTDPFTRLVIQNSTTGTKSLEIRIGAGGDARMCDPDTNLSATDLRRCQP